MQFMFLYNAFSGTCLFIQDDFDRLCSDFIVNTGRRNTLNTIVAETITEQLNTTLIQ